MKSGKKPVRFTSALQVVIPYLFLTVLWFLLFDQVVNALVGAPPPPLLLEIWKDGLFIAASVVLLFFTVRHTLRRREQAEHELQQREAMLHTIIDSMGDIVFTLDRQQRHTRIFGSWTERYGLSAGYFLGKTSREITGDEETATLHEAANLAALTGEYVIYEWSVGPLHIQTALSPITDAAGETVGIVGVGRDISPLKHIEQELRNISRAHRMLSSCNQVLVRATDETTLLRNICQSIVQVGDYRMAWVGFAYPDEEKKVIPAAQAGHDEGYLESAHLTWANSERGRSPVGTAIRTQQPAVARNIQTDPDFLPWRDDAVKRGYASSIALPLLFGDDPHTPPAQPGVLVLYAPRPDAFDEAEIELLSELAEDLAYGIRALRTRAEHQRTAARLGNILEIAANAIIAVDAEHRIQLFNPAAELSFGFHANEVMGKPFPRLLDPASIETYYEYAAEVAAMTTAQRSGAYCEVLARRREGRTFPVELSLAHASQDGETTCTIILHDISAQKQAEEDLIASHNRIQTILESITDGFIAFDTAWRFVYVNHEAERLLQRTREELLEQNVWDAFPEAVTSRFYPEYHRVVNERVSSIFETYYEPMQVWFEVHAYPSKDGMSAYFRDISERKRTEQELHRVNHALRTLSECNQALVRATEETELLQNICQSIVQGGGYRMAWIGFAEEDGEKRVVPVAHAGQERDYFDRLYITWDDTEWGQGPTGRAIRTRTPCVVNDVQHDPGYCLWREQALEQGYASSVALPLFDDTYSSVPIRGALNIYGAEPDTFDSPTIELLTELAQDVVYGLVALRTRAEHRQLFEQVQLAHERLQMLSRRLVEVQEQERRHIARELHDEIGQSLTGLHLLLEMMSRIDCERVGNKLDDAHALVSDLMSRVREMSLDLRPAMLDDLGLLPTLRWHFQRYTTQTGIYVLFKHTGVDQRFSSESETVVYRLVQEALTNVARYANVQEATVRLWSDEKSIGVQIEDSGDGFDPDRVLASNSSSGLAGMQERVFLLGGELTIESSPGRGTCLSAEIPR